MTAAQRALLLAGVGSALFAAAPATAELVLSEVIVDLLPTVPAREDVEAWNNGSERLYLEVQPAEIVDPGQLSERRVDGADPTQTGLLVTPQRIILEPGERRLIRIAALAPRPDRDRVYRVAIKPIAGAIEGKTSAIKIMVGYDVLVIFRPAQPRVQIDGQRAGRALGIVNSGNTNAELYDGKQCAMPTQCVGLPAKRIYAGERWTQQLPRDGTVEYHIKSVNGTTTARF